MKYKNQLIIIIKKEWKWVNKDMIINGNFRKDTTNCKEVKITTTTLTKKDTDKLVRTGTHLLTTSTQVKLQTVDQNMKTGNPENIDLKFQLSLLNIQICNPKTLHHQIDHQLCFQMIK